MISKIQLRTSKNIKMRCTMKTLWAVVLLLALSMPAAAAGNHVSIAKGHGGVNMTEMRLFLNSFAALGEGHIENVLNGLKLLSVTDEVRSGKWDEMKPVLAEFARGDVKAAAVWFARPDGSYYSVEKGLTGQNLRDREYFPGLMSGKDVTGDLVLSKTTGQRTAIVAVPVRRAGKIIGALGASLSVEQISKMLDEKMALPGNFVFYALDQKGRTSLHKKSALIFAYPSDMGSKSLAETVQEMLAKNEGEVAYDFHGERRVVFKRFPLTGWVYAIGQTEKGVVPPQDLLIRSEVETAVSMLQAIHERQVHGEMTLAQAKKLGAGLLRELRYGDGGYFWADTTEGVNVVLYGRKDAEGRNRLEDKDSNGTFYIKELIAKAEAGGGYVEYLFPRKGESAPQEKRSYVLLFKPFGWVIGTGYYR